MKRLFLFLAVACLFAVSSVWATPTYVPVTDPNFFTQSVDWCTLASSGCSATLPTPTAWTASTSGFTGQAGMFYSRDDFAVTPDPSGMGLINSTTFVIKGVLYVDDIAASFDSPVFGAGAYIETSYAGTFYPQIYLFNNVYNELIGYEWQVTFSGMPGERIFIGAASSDLEVSIVGFELGSLADPSDPNYQVVPYSVGTLGFNTPEPGSLALMAPALLGLAAMLRRRTRKG